MPQTVTVPVAERLRAEVARREPRLLEILSRLTAAASPNPPGDTAAVARVAGDLLREIPGMAVTEHSPAAPVVNLVGRLKGRAPGRRLVFNGHLDTFPIGKADGWSHDPLAATLADGRVYGRGVSDMKGGMACSILAAEILAEHRDDWCGEVVLTLAGDEETMGVLGTKYLLDTVPHATGDAMICGDAGSPSVIRFGEKGLVWVEIEAEGHSAHGAHVHLGVNAYERLMAGLSRLLKLRSLLPHAPERVTEAIRGAKRLSEGLSGKGESRVLQRVTVNLGRVEAGSLPNLVPDRAWAAADIRLPVGVTVLEVERQLEALLGGLPGLRYRVLRSYEPNWTDPEHEIIRFCADRAAAALGRKPAVNMRVGASDARWYRLHGVPTVVFGPTPYNMGGADEYVTLDDLRVVAQVHTLAAFDFLSASA